MTKYETLVNVLDAIIKEAPASMRKKYPSVSDVEQQNQARARAFIHLYLKVSFGLLDFEQREHYVTDGSYDGGIDGYFIDNETKSVSFIQSKFRNNIKNFESKNITLEEILVMDIGRITDGELHDDNENPYNGKIKQLQRELSSVDDIARYSYKVIILANVASISSAKLRMLTGGVNCQVFDFEKCYADLVFPVITGTFFNASDLKINIDLSNKNAGSKISYTVQTKRGECEITVLFVPVLEVAKMMYKYKNAILKYNPRSYLGHDEGKSVNKAIRETIIEKSTNEFALFNNGITMLSDETNINEKIGQKNKAQLIIKNPQIINGGQTSYSLSLIYEEYENGEVDKVFQDKEVLLKIITLLENNNHAGKVELINEISEATNKQTPVLNADRISNDDLQIDIQKILFDRYGLLYERKRGEFADGIFNNYINESEVLERNLFFRMFYASNGEISKAKEKKLFVNQNLTLAQIDSKSRLDKTYFALLCFRKIVKSFRPNQRFDIGIYAKVFAMVLLFRPESIVEYPTAASDNFEFFESKWAEFLSNHEDKVYVEKPKFEKRNYISEVQSHRHYAKWFNSADFRKDIVSFYKA